MIKISDINAVRLIPIVVLSVMSIFVISLGVCTMRKQYFIRRDRIFLAGGFFLYGIGGLINLIYYLIGIFVPNEIIIKFLYAVGGSCLFLAIVSLIIFQHSKRNPRFHHREQYKISLIFIIIIPTLTLITTFLLVQYDQSTNWAPLWSPWYSLYWLAILGGLILIEVREAYKIYKLLKDQAYKSSEEGAVSWRYFNIGFIGIASAMTIPAFANLFLDALLRSISFSLVAFFIILSVIFLYRGLYRRTG